MWTEVTLYHGTVQQKLNEIRSFLAILLQIVLAYMTKSEGIGILQKSLWLSHFRTSLHKCGLNSCICVFFLSLVVRLLAQCIVDYVHTDIPVVSIKNAFCVLFWMAFRLSSFPLLLYVPKIYCSYCEQLMWNCFLVEMDGNCKRVGPSGELFANLNIDLFFQALSPPHFEMPTDIKLP